MEERTCLACGKPVGGTRRRKYCDNNDRCKRRYLRGARAAKVKPLPKSQSQSSSVEKSTRADLTAAGVLETPLGAAAVALAARIDEGHRETGQSLASLAKQLQATLEAAKSNVTRKATPLDEAQDELARRRAKRGA
jgi:hypothetical protein